MTIINITKPTVEQRDSIEVTLPNETNMAAIETNLAQIAASVPGVLVQDLQRKIDLVRQHLIAMEALTSEIAQDPALHHSLEMEISHYRGSIDKLECEREFNQ